MACRSYHERVAGMGRNYVWSVCPLWSSLDITRATLHLYPTFNWTHTETSKMASAGNICLTRKGEVGIGFRENRLSR